MFSSLPKIADKTFVIAFLAPILFFELAVASAFSDLPAVARIVAAIGSEQHFTGLTLAVAATWFGALALLLVNRPLYRALEGYIGPLAGAARKADQRRRWQARRRGLKAQLARARGLAGRDRDDAAAAYNDARADFRQQFPLDPDRVLGTRFGNINRAFEDYPSHVYGVDGVVIWSRLSAVVPAAFQTTLADARAQVDCFVNLTVLAVFLAALEIGHWAVSLGASFHAASWRSSALLAQTIRQAWLHARWDAVMIAVVCLLFARAAYAVMLDRAIALGEQVKSAFDLYLRALSVQLGYDLPPKLDDQAVLWKALRRSYVYFDPAPDAHRLPVSMPPAAERPRGGPEQATTEEKDEPDEPTGDDESEPSEPDS